MKYLLIILAVIVCAFFFLLGQKSVEPTVPICQETKLTLVASRINDKEAVCVYVESWQIKGKTKRKEYAVQKKTT